MEKPKATTEHEWLQQLTGEWDWVMEMPEAEPGKPPHRGIARSRMLGEVWLISDWYDDQAEAAGPSSIQTIGFDPEKGAFVGSFISAMMARQWVYEGRLQDNRTALVLEAEGPHMQEPGKTMRYRDITHLQGNDGYTLESEYYDGSTWQHFMRARFTRRR